MNFLNFFIILSTFIVKLTADSLDENFLFQIKGKVLPFVKTYAPVYYVRITALLANGAFDAIAPYHNTVKGIHSSIQKRPENERTIRNKNTAIAYASLRILNKLLPSGRYIWENELIMAGLDPQDISTDITTPNGIGNFVADRIINTRMDDGMNQEGNDKTYHKARYSDFVSYKPKNDPYEIKFPDNWQPLINEVDYGVYASQVHVVPQYGRETPYSIKNVELYMAPIPVKSKVSNMDGYVEQVQTVLTESYTLDNKKKMMAEYFEDKTWSLDGAVEGVVRQNILDLDEYIFLQMAVKIALHDAGIVAWKEKVHYDSVRPTTAIRFLYENETLKAWGGPGVGPVDDIKGKEWRSYIPTGPHSEYPSGTTCFCSTQAQVLRRYFNSDIMNHSVKFPRGSSLIEPWRTPTEDTLAEFSTYDEYVKMCGISRVYAGVHFQASADEAEKLCKLVGDVAYEFVYAQVNGDFTDFNVINNEDKIKRSLKFH